MITHLPATLDRIETLNTYVHDQHVRQFQQDILTTGSFQLVSPWSGRELDCAEARLISFVNDPYHFQLPLYAYRFTEQADLWLMSFQIGFGFPLCALFIPDTYYAYLYPSPAAPTCFGVLKRLTQELEALNATPYETANLNQPLAILGHPNFAHHMWNELPALKTLQEEAHVQTRTLFAPLGPLEGLPQPVPFSPLQQRGAPYFSPIGGEKLDQRTSDSLTCEMPPVQVRPGHSGSPMIWVAHREDGRKCENFLDFLAAFERQARESCMPSYILDSFSAPADLDQPWYDPVRPAFDIRKAQSDALFTRMISAIGRPDAVVTTTSGLSVMQAMALARQADFYIAPIGSIQHKVAWLQSIPGLIHGPQSAMNPHVANWHGQKSEIAVAPQVLPDELIEDTRASARHPNAARNMDYRIRDPELAAKFTLQHMRDVLGLTP